ncbi:hypothetical protein [Cohaesibacter celericrescens]|uniref:hypothetical protein n=1 Tax=Cohaesibacter celericrescens TaxID=2067669 RepID=UPI00356970BB
MKNKHRHTNIPNQLSFTHLHGITLPSPLHHQILLVFFLPRRQEWQKRVDMRANAGYEAVQSNINDRDAVRVTFQDPDIYRIALQNRAWSA